MDTGTVADRLAILDLEGEYARAWDVADAEGWASVFTENGVFEMGAFSGRSPERLVGRASLAEFCRSINSSYSGLHLMHIPRLSIDGDCARGWIHFDFRAHHSGEILCVTGLYHATYERRSEGWRIRHRFEQAVFDGTEYEAIPQSVAGAWNPKGAA